MLYVEYQYPLDRSLVGPRAILDNIWSVPLNVEPASIACRRYSGKWASHNAEQPRMLEGVLSCMGHYVF
jgi:hypothetical protein